MLAYGVIIVSCAMACYVSIVELQEANVESNSAKHSISNSNNIELHSIGDRAGMVKDYSIE